METNQSSLRDGIIALAEKHAKGYLKSYSETRGYRSIALGTSWEALMKNLANVVLEYSHNFEGKSLDMPNPEETAAILIRSGVPATAIEARHKHLTVSLTNGEYRIYREPSGSGSGTFRILRPENSPVIKANLTSQGLADLLLEFDSALDGVEDVMRKLMQDLKAVDFRKQVEAKSRDIERTTIKTLLDTVLAPLGIIGYFNIKDGVVSLRLVKALQADLEMPFDEMAGFLSDPQKVNDGLSRCSTSFRTITTRRTLKVVSVDEFRDLSHIGGNHLGSKFTVYWNNNLEPLI